MTARDEVLTMTAIPSHWSTDDVQVATFVHYYPDLGIERIAIGLAMGFQSAEIAVRLLLREKVLDMHLHPLEGRAPTFSSTGVWSPDDEDEAA